MEGRPLTNPTGTARAWKLRQVGESLGTGLFYYGLTSAIAVLGLLFGHYFLERQWYRRTKPDALIGAFTGWDGYWYQRIATEGYSYDPKVMSSVAFFPGYPLLGRYLAAVTGLSAAVALVAIAHFCLAVTFVLLLLYVRRRLPKDAAALGAYVLLALGLWPTAVFFRVAHSESMFLLVAVLFLYALERRWPLLVISLLAGLGTAVRPVGVSFLVPLLLAIWHRSGRKGSFALQASFLLPIACWGILGYTLYQGLEFGTPLAFVQTQSLWQVSPALPWSEKLLALLGLEPIWSVFVPSSRAFWEHHDGPVNPVFSWHIANIVFYVLAVALTFAGARKGDGSPLTRSPWRSHCC